jgi:2-polyprenyl-3-methyl-5-hydroxy-6-metoxy-1,4-benzoquinol methylase
MLADEAQRRVSPDAGPILEIGAGLGVTSVAMAKTGYRMVATDYDADALAFIRANARLNDAELVDVRHCDWREPPPETFPVVIGSDVLYENRHLEPLARFLRAGLEAEGQALISTPTRASCASFPATASRMGLHVETVPAQASSIARHGEGGETVIRGRVYCVRKPK